MTIVRLLLAVMVALALNAAVVLGLGDSHILTPPPEAVCESFLRELVTQRYQRALPYLDEEFSQRCGVDKLRRCTLELQHRTGSIKDVRGESSSMQSDEATAVVVLETDASGQVPIHLQLTRRQGVWSIVDLGELAETSNQRVM